MPQAPPAPASPRSAAALPTGVEQPARTATSAASVVNITIQLTDFLFMRRLLFWLDIAHRAAKRRISDGAEKAQAGKLFSLRLLLRHGVVLNRGADRFRQRD